MKGIVLAGGSGTRLRPATLPISKQLLPVYDKPMIYYPLSVFLQAGIKDILIITRPEEIEIFRKLLGDGSAFGINLQYAPQAKPNGLAEAFIIGEEFVGDSSAALILGDNIFYGEGLADMCMRAFAKAEAHGEATIFAYGVSDPERYGVVSFDATGKAQTIEEKPAQPKSNWAVTGFYIYDKRVCQHAKAIKPSARGELEITDLNRIYLEAGKLNVEKLGRGFAWLDTGTFDSLHEASSFVRTIELRQGIKIACLEEIALGRGLITPDQAEAQAKAMGSNEYATYIMKRAAETRHGRQGV
ncbi:glucose-1-phosphate thymidylyltransferase RfbA [Aestuariivirga litoralis]|uniref:glucose-1-phosphate thymidylyltransferase RfbA n=1 Tax=Aestuariivirga litoralis TaxID=2650924 RepID=UPI0018C73068|nr:glucose-1-phosphate thymidylyltransferase RfbA [Aestuariivirga litoralis]MBG1230984.1 glucose-1-phosphate thymidylyltransferase RfbA [Aestuariivirga litoralis]